MYACRDVYIRTHPIANRYCGKVCGDHIQLKAFVHMLNLKLSNNTLRCFTYSRKDGDQYIQKGNVIPFWATAHHIHWAIVSECY